MIGENREKQENYPQNISQFKFVISSQLMRGENREKQENFPQNIP